MTLRTRGCRLSVGPGQELALRSGFQSHGDSAPPPAVTPVERPGGRSVTPGRHSSRGGSLISVPHPLLAGAGTVTFFKGWSLSGNNTFVDLVAASTNALNGALLARRPGGTFDLDRSKDG